LFCAKAKFAQNTMLINIAHRAIMRNGNTILEPATEGELEGSRLVIRLFAHWESPHEG